jgi:hypothetical protein
LRRSWKRTRWKLGRTKRRLRGGLVEAGTLSRNVVFGDRSFR